MLITPICILRYGQVEFSVSLNILWFLIAAHVGTDPPAKPSPASASQNPTHFLKTHQNVSFSVWAALALPVKNNTASSDTALVTSLRHLSHKACYSLLHNFPIDPKQLGNSCYA